MKYILLAVIFNIILLFTISCEKAQENESYLTKWLGTYEGTSHHWSSYPGSGINEPFLENHYDKKVQVNIQKSDKDSCLNFLIIYNDSIIDEKNDLPFSVSGIHHSQWGGGSGFGSLDVNIDSDSLHYDYFQKCGIPCSGGIDFVIARND